MVAKSLVEVCEAWVGLKKQDDTGQLVASGQCEIFLEPFNGDRIAVQEFRTRLASHPPIVVATWQVDGNE